MNAASHRVFISYSHDNSEHTERVEQLARTLRRDGVDVRLDQYEGAGPEAGWREWMQSQIEEADFVLLVCTEKYRERSRKRADPQHGWGAIWELNLIYQEFQQVSTVSGKFIPIVFHLTDKQFIPAPFGDRNCHCLEWQEQYENLYWTLTGQQPGAPPLGALCERPDDEGAYLFERPGRAPRTLEEALQSDVLRRAYSAALKHGREPRLPDVASQSALHVR